jgi:hypothetical protein
MAAMLPIGVTATTIGEFGAGFPVVLAINSQMGTWLQWVIGSLTIVRIPVLGEIVATEKVAPFSLWAEFKSRIRSSPSAATPLATAQPGFAQRPLHRRPSAASRRWSS